MNSEPSRIMAALNAALLATVGLLTLLGVWAEEIGGAVAIAAAAWLLVAGEIVRARVTPVVPVGEV